MLGEGRRARSCRFPEKLLRYDLIVIDELDYLPFSQSGGQRLFQLISKLYEKHIAASRLRRLAAGIWRRQNDYRNARSAAESLPHR
jgi:hypothetical protein